MEPVGHYIFIAGFKVGDDPMEEKSSFKETEVVSISPDVKVPFKIGDRVMVSQRHIIRYKDHIIIPLDACVMYKKN